MSIHVQDRMAPVATYRHRKILEMVYERECVSSNELAAEFGVSLVTIRRDLKVLAQGGLLQQARGEAQRVPDLQLEALFKSKDKTAKREKVVIGRYVASLVADTETVFVNGGSTTLEVVRHLRGKDLRVVTNNAACLELDLDPGIELILLGGEYRPGSRSVVGPLTVASLQSLFAGITVLGINGVSTVRGCTSAVQSEAVVNQAMIANSNGRILIVADHHKLGRVSSFLTCSLERVDMLITDAGAPQAACDEFAAAGVSVHRVADEVPAAATPADQR
jgi:DeoR/GlpR family transcriptional regulator of sugar metabolism